MVESGKRVLLLSLHYRPEPNFITADVAESLARAGYRVTVVTAHPNYPLGRFYDSVSSLKPTRTEESGVTVWRVPFFPDHSRSKLLRLLSYGSFTLAAAVLAPLIEPQPDVVWVYNAPFTTGLASIFFRYFRGAKVAFMCPDLWPESFPAAGVAPPRPILNAMYSYSRWINRRAHLLVTTTLGMLRRYASDGIAPARMRLVPLWVDGAAAPPDAAADEACGGPITLVYAGNLGPAQALDVVLRGAKRLEDEGIAVEIHFYGAGSEEPRLQALAAELALKGVVWKGRVSPEEAFRASAEATAQIVHLAPSPLFRMTVPSKLAFCLAAGRPVLTGLEGEAREVAAASGGSIAFEAGSDEGFARAVRELAIMPPSAQQAMGARGRRYFEANLLPEALCARYAELTEELLEDEDARPYEVRAGEIVC